MQLEENAQHVFTTHTLNLTVHDFCASRSAFETALATVSQIELFQQHRQSNQGNTYDGR